MTYYSSGDDATVTYPVTDDEGSILDFSPIVTATDTSQAELTVEAAWVGPAEATRDLKIELQTLPHGLWHLRLAIAGADDLDLGQVVIVDDD